MTVNNLFFGHKPNYLWWHRETTHPQRTGKKENDFKRKFTLKNAISVNLRLK